MSDFYNICNESMYIVYLERKKSVHYKSFIICTSKRERERVISARTRQRDERRKKTERARYNHVLVSGITDGVHRPSRVNTVARPEPLILLRLSLATTTVFALPYLYGFFLFFVFLCLLNGSLLLTTQGNDSQSPTSDDVSWTPSYNKRHRS